MRRWINIPLKPDEASALAEAALRQDRDPRRQAQRYLREGLERDGLLSEVRDRAEREPELVR